MSEAVARAQKDIIIVGGRLVRFMSHQQRLALMQMLGGEEKEGTAEMLLALADRVEKMPFSYQTDGQGDNAVVYLHYFMGGADAFITEKDMGAGSQRQAFGLADLFGGDGELGYISIEEWIANDAELDLYWTPKTLKEVKGSR